MQRLVFRVDIILPDDSKVLSILEGPSIPLSAANLATPFECSIDDPAFVKMRASPPSPNATRDAGRRLYDAITRHPGISELLSVALAAGAPERYPIFVQTGASSDIEALPWEALCTPDGEFLALDDRWTVSRIAGSSATSQSPWQLKPPLRIAAILSALGVSAAEEWRALQASIQSATALAVEVLVLLSEEQLYDEITAAVAAGHAPGVAVEFLPPDTAALQVMVSRFQPHVLHFFCHGSASIVPHLEVAVRSDWHINATQSSLLLEARDILDLSGTANDTWLAVLNFAESAIASDRLDSLAHSLVHSGLPAAIGMRESVSAEDAALFTGAFYSRFLQDLASRLAGVAQDRSINLGQLVVAARRSLATKHKAGTVSKAAASTTEWTLPAIYVRPAPIDVIVVPARPSPAEAGYVPETAPAEAATEAVPAPATSDAGPVQTGPVAANYSADTFDREILVEGDTDTLGIRGDVDVLSSVIASRRIHPPLSIGIFGAWGAGKSFLMNQLRLRVAQLASAARSVPEHDETPSYYCGDIVPIEFNAWQYAGGELWASLINRVFEGIRDHLGSDEEYRKVIDAIERQDETVRQAARRLAEAEQQVKRAVSPAERRTVAQVEASNPELAEAASSFAKNLGLDKEELDLVDVAVRTRELGTLAGRIREGWSRQGQRGKAVVFSALAIGAVLLGAATALPSVASAIVAVAGVLTPVLAVIASILKPTGDALRAGMRILDAGDQEKQRYAESKAAYEDAREELERLRRQGPGGLYGFVEDRYRAEDYRRALGMVSLIREDLKRLGAFTASERGAPGIERVVLYIDDLDRCPSEQVVRVLEAVNLLFAFPLFVVVIAVDSRWLIRSLEENFQGIFGAGQTPAPTPQDYLEKVIQIPFWLQQMGEGGFGRLVSTLARPPARNRRTNAGRSTSATAETASQKEPTGQTSPATVAVTPDGRGEAGTRGTAASPGPEASEGTDGSNGTSSPTPPEPKPAEPGAARASEAAEIDPRPETLVITDSELEFLHKLAPLVDTPRAAKRLLNTYQLARVSVEDVPYFLEHSVYEPLLVLLALVTSSPGLTASITRSLFDSGEPDLRSFLNKLDAADDVERPGWMRLRDDLGRCPISGITIEAIRKWLPVVSRFSFQPGLAQFSAPDSSPRQ